MLTLLLALVGLLFLSLFFSDPFIIFLLVVAIYEKRLKKMMAPTHLKGKQLFKQALTHGSDEARKIARRGAFFQATYGFLWGISLFAFACLFIYQKDFVYAAILVPIAALFFYWASVFLRLWHSKR